MSNSSLRARSSSQKTADLRKHGSRPFTINTKFGRITIKRCRLFNPKTGKTVIPSALVWNTQHNRHPASSLLSAVCETSQELSYRKTQEHLSQVAGVDSLLSSSAVWNYKQKAGKHLELSQQELIERGLKQHGITLKEHGFFPPQ
jgi:hypothetical protein